MKIGYDTPHQVVQRMLKTHASARRALWSFEILTMAAFIATFAVSVLAAMAGIVWAFEQASEAILGFKSVLFTTFLGLCWMLGFVKVAKSVVVKLTSQTRRSQ